ncbi:MAG TPA: hypothetical protein VER17_21400 [Tepidisphaeraceae bacterium]|nr:hypothetical protein [Tepidisphaeraceae bacterium]
MGVHESRGNLAKAFKELMLRWADTRASWDDVRAEEFEKQYLQQLESDLRTTGSAMDQMGVLLSQARRDCE